MMENCKKQQGKKMLAFGLMVKVLDFCFLGFHRNFSF